MASTSNQSVSKLISQVASAGGFAKPNRFRVQITPTNAITNVLASPFFKAAGITSTNMNQRLTFFCESSELPAKVFGTTDVRYYGPTFKRPNQPTYGDLNLLFYVGDDMLEKYFFDAWHYAIEDPISQNIHFPQDYISDIVIYQVSDAPDSAGNDVTYYATLEDAWPIGIGQIRLDYAATNQIHKLPISISYRRWVNDTVNVGTGSSFSPNVSPLKLSNTNITTQS